MQACWPSLRAAGLHVAIPIGPAYFGVGVGLVIYTGGVRSVCRSVGSMAAIERVCLEMSGPCRWQHVDLSVPCLAIVPGVALRTHEFGVPRPELIGLLRHDRARAPC